ncbi:MAG: redoxin domain-containing protein [Alphaproteobacteria bacterium]|nr:MAG: redoxin domain-containing protein [Alphaproteobacteria bacterium]
MSTTTATSLPDFNQPGLTWFNVPKPLSISEVFGRLVILDFWTFSCINCLHILPSMRRIEKAFQDDVVILGIHSPNFPYERDPINVSKAIARYHIEHPVVHDPEFKLWDAYGVKVWPTLILVSPDGQIFARQAGEPDGDKLLEAVGNAVRKYKAQGKLRPAGTELTKPEKQGGVLLFPGKMKRLKYKGNFYWVVADTGHHQIVIFNDQGQQVQRIGRGAPANLDGEYNRCAFDNPHGIACGEDVIYVSDLGTHLIRRIDLKAQTVTTIAGTNRRGLTLTKEAPGKEVGLASVFDMELHGDQLYFANSGTHQIGVIDTKTLVLKPLAGGGAKDILDGAGRAAKLAQPSGLAFSAEHNRLYFADSDNSAVRYLDLADQFNVRTVVGRGMAESGRRNGSFKTARFQHPMGITICQDYLIAADSFNASLRKLDIAKQTVENFAEDFTCTDEAPKPLLDPEGIVWDGADRLFVVDSNNHRILAYDLTKKTWGTWTQ